jgi:hypothetical protein
LEAQLGGIMQQQAPAAVHGPESHSARHSQRTMWIITGYLASGLALLGVFAYYFATYVTH